MSEERIPLSEPHLSGNTRAYLEECVRTNFVSSVGPFVERFEQEFAAYCGSRYAVACSTGTAAIHVALRLCGVEPGDEVMVSDLTFIASANPVAYERAIPVLVDAEEETWNIDPERVVEEIKRRVRHGRPLPKVVEAVHILGHPARLEPIADVCDEHGIVLVEDAAEALGARWSAGRFSGRHVGTVGRMGCFSFNGNKILTTGGGGMIVTDDEQLARRAKHLTTQARLPGAEYRHDEVGYNYRLTNLAAALGVAQLEELPSFLDRKRAIAERYDESLRGLPGLSTAPRAPWASPSHWLYTVQFDTTRDAPSREAIRERLGRQSIEARPIWTPLHLMPMYRDAPRLGGEVAERLFARALSLPSSVGLTDQQQGRVIDAIRR